MRLLPMVALMAGICIFTPVSSHADAWYLIDKTENVKFFGNQESIRKFSDGSVSIYAITAVKGPTREYAIDYFNFTCQQPKYGIPYRMKIGSTEIIDRWGNVLEYIPGKDQYFEVEPKSAAEALAYFACNNPEINNLKKYSFKSELLADIIKEWGE